MITGNRYYNNPQIGQALNNIAQAFLGSPAEDADIARTRLLNAQTGAVTQSTSGIEQLAQILAQGAGADPSALYSAGARGGVLNQIPDALLGFNAATNPGISDDAISNLMLGAGVAASSTPVGLNATLANNLEQEGMRQAGALQRQTLADLILNEDQTALIADPARAGNLGGNQFNGLRSPLSLTEAQGGAFSSLPLDDQQNVLLSDINVEEIMGPDGPLIVSRGDAIGQAPFQSGGTAQTPRNYIVTGADGQPIAQSSGYMTPEGRLIDIGTQEPVLVPEGAQVRMQSVDGEGGMVFEADGQGGFRLMTGANNTVATQSRLQGQSLEATRILGLLQDAFTQIDSDDVGVRGNFNEIWSRVAGQIDPSLARNDVIGDRALMAAVNEQVMAALTADNRLSDADVRRLQRMTPRMGLWETEAGARATIAELMALFAYNQAHAASAMGGDGQLRDMGPEQLRELVQSGALPAEVAIAVASSRNWNPPGGEAAAAGSPYQPGYEEGGYRFTGGDPTSPDSWERIQ